jgi:multicomponent Na+:H+ antiporter subunit F
LADFLLAAAAFVLAMVALGLLRILRGPSATDRIMAAQLLGTGGIAVLLLVARSSPMPGVVDAALVLALLAAFVSVAFVKAARRPAAGGPKPTDVP